MLRFLIAQRPNGPCTQREFKQPTQRASYQKFDVLQDRAAEIADALERGHFDRVERLMRQGS